jgi:tetratricopeptide (TPR) repeat protein
MIGDVLMLDRRYADATEHYRTALQITDALAARDGKNAQVSRDRLTYLCRLADAEQKSGHAVEARSLTREALQILRPMVESDTESQFALYQYAWLLVTTPFAELKSPQEALRAAQRLKELTNGNDPNSLDVLARAYAGVGKYGDALEAEESALALLPKGQNSSVRAEFEANRSAFQARAEGHAARRAN